MKTYRRMLKDARGDLQKALEEREEIDKRIAGLKQTVVAIARLCGPIEEKELMGLDFTGPEAIGITDQCREVLKTSDIPMTPVEVRNQLVRMGLDASKYQNLMASVHKILKRLFNAGEIGQAETDDGEVSYYKIKRRSSVRRKKEPKESEAKRDVRPGFTGEAQKRSMLRSAV